MMAALHMCQLSMKILLLTRPLHVGCALCIFLAFAGAQACCRSWKLRHLRSDSCEVLAVSAPAWSSSRTRRAMWLDWATDLCIVGFGSPVLHGSPCARPSNIGLIGSSACRPWGLPPDGLLCFPPSLSSLPHWLKQRLEQASADSATALADPIRRHGGVASAPL